MTETNSQDKPIKLKKSKKIGKLEFIAAGALGVSAIIAGLSLDRETLSESLVAGGLLAGGVSTIAGYHTSVSRQFLEEYIKDYKEDNRDEIGLKSKYKYE